MNEKIVCPLGSQCTKMIDDDTIERCAWHVKLQGIDAQGEKHDDWRCALAWLPILNINVADASRHTASAIDSFRNETVTRQEAAMKMMEKSDAIKALKN